MKSFQEPKLHPPGSIDDGPALWWLLAAFARFQASGKLETFQARLLPWRGDVPHQTLHMRLRRFGPPLNPGGDWTLYGLHLDAIPGPDGPWTEGTPLAIEYSPADKRGIVSPWHEMRHFDMPDLRRLAQERNAR